MERYPDDNPVEKLFRDRTREDYLADAIRMVLDSDILDHSHAAARTFRDRAIEASDVLPDTPDRAALIDIADYVLARRS